MPPVDPLRQTHEITSRPYSPAHALPSLMPARRSTMTHKPATWTLVSCCCTRRACDSVATLDLPSARAPAAGSMSMTFLAPSGPLFPLYPPPLIASRKLISTPIITATLVQDDSKTSARIVKAKIEKTMLGQVLLLTYSWSRGRPWVSPEVAGRGGEVWMYPPCVVTSRVGGMGSSSVGCLLVLRCYGV